MLWSSLASYSTAIPRESVAIYAGDTALLTVLSVDLLARAPLDGLVAAVVSQYDVSLARITAQAVVLRVLQFAERYFLFAFVVDERVSLLAAGAQQVVFEHVALEHR